MARFMDKTLQEGYDIGRKEVAREIFEEIEKRVRFEAYDLDDLVIDLAELKKKYTEDINHED